MAGVVLNKWAPGVSYGPVLSQTELYLLNNDVELNPLLKGEVRDCPLQFHMLTGFSANQTAAEAGLYGKDEPATIPRISQMILISRQTPWCTIIRKDTGITIGDICSAIFKDYSENDVTEAEFSALPPRGQEQLKRSAMHNQNNGPGAANQWAGYYTPQHGPERMRRVDWLRERIYFEGLSKDDNYAKSRLGFKAPNIFVMELVS